MDFNLLSATRTDRRQELYCDTLEHLAITFPLNEYSGEGLDINKSPCTCAPPPSDESDSASG